MSFADFKSPEPSGDRVMPRTKVRVRAAHAFLGNIAVLSHLKYQKGSNLGIIQACLKPERSVNVVSSWTRVSETTIRYLQSLR